MVTVGKTIEIEPDSDLDRLLKEADAGPITLKSADARYRVERIEPSHDLRFRSIESLWDDYDPESVRAAILAAAGTWSDVDAEELKEFIYRRRQEGTRVREGR